MPRRALQPLDITLRHGRAYQLTRKLFLGFSVALTFGLPLWHLRVLEAQGAGIAQGSPWDGLAQLFPVTAPPFVGAPTAIELWGVELVDPLATLSVMVDRGVSWPLVWSVLPGVLLVLALGRFFCGWACPYLPILAASNAARWFLARVGVPIKAVQVPRVTGRVLLVGVLVVSAVFGVQVLPLVYPPALIGRAMFHTVFYGSLGLGALLVLGAFLFDTFVSRAGFCRSLCPGGAMFSVLGNASPLRIKRDIPKCTDCTVCDVVCNLGQKPMTDKLDSGCERCGKCIASCPTQALSWSLGKPAMLRPDSEKPGT
jgi:ferredoxin-type protein NapH